MTDLPASAGWKHRGLRDGFEVAFFRRGEGRSVARGQTAALEAGVLWTVGYEISLDTAGRTRSAAVWGTSADGEREIRLVGDGHGAWTLAGQPLSAIDGCLDVDLESSALTNAFPIRRLGLRVGEAADAPAAYVRVRGLAVERLEQRYVRIPATDGGSRYDYEAPAFEFTARLSYDHHGLPLEYPSIAERVL